ncbi:DNA-binding domain-containing protein [Crenobacter sp. SG2303]|uniref:DNA-binding domain-containing protein n=1 Tax=Crenobacter oryzisoli TaxID=3056844 RepID=A0ABT7XM64_9NEIS|nr:DNA-binding domain-containing protein [Crenobacter sp. SG2303]MDN0074877.1 DNA-binding domain-containing protein [Crenobacter sp. SG2303]
MSDWQRWQAGLIAAIHDPALPDTAYGADGLAVYRNNYRVGLIDTVKSLYPVIAQLVGDDFLTGLAREYVRRTPSASGNLHRYGEGFGNFVDGFEPAADLPYLGGVARLEWALHRAYYAVDATQFSPATLAAIAPESWGELCLAFQPACALVRSAHWPIVAIWQAHRPGGAPSRVDLGSGGENALVYRQPDLEAGLLPLSDADAAFIAALMGGATLETATDAALTLDADFDLQPLLVTLLQTGCLAA